jgi:hypothetical protein
MPKENRKSRKHNKTHNSVGQGDPAAIVPNNVNSAPAKESAGSPVVSDPEPERANEPANESAPVVHSGQDYSIARLTKQGIHPQEVVPITIFGRQPLSAERRVYLQRQGLRTMVLGWKIGWVVRGDCRERGGCHTEEGAFVDWRYQ